MQYKHKNYEQTNILPPNTDPLKLSKGKLYLHLLKLKYLSGFSSGSQFALGRVKFWGQNKYHYVDITESKGIQFDIKCKNQTFSQYLRDMRNLNIQIIDSRNDTVICKANVNFLLYIKQKITKQQQSAFIQIEQTFDLNKKSGNIEKKIGQISIKINSIFFKQNQNEKIIKQIKNQNTYIWDKKIQQIRKNSNLIDLPQSSKVGKEINLKYNINKMNENKMVNKMIDDDVICGVINKNDGQIINGGIIMNRRQKLKKREQGLIQDLRYVVKGKGQDFDNEILRLELQANQLLNKDKYIMKIEQNIVLIIKKLLLDKNDEIALQIKYPTFINNKIQYQNQTINGYFNKNQIIYDHKILIHPHNAIQDKFVYIKLKNKKQILSNTQITLTQILSNQTSQVQLKHYKTNKKIAKLLILSQNKHIHNNQPSQIIHIPPQPKFKKHTKLHKTLLFLIQIQKSQIKYRQSIKKISFKLQNIQYQTPQTHNNHFHTHIICPINNNQQILPFLYFQIWEIQTQNIIIGVAKIKLENLNQIIQNSIQDTNLNPFLLFDSNLKITSLNKNQYLGFISLSVYIGTPNQINRFNQKMRVLAISKNINNSTQNRQKVEQYTQTNQLVKIESTRKMETHTQQKNIEIYQGQQINQINLVQTLTKFYELLWTKKIKADYLLSSININENINQQQFIKFLQGFLTQNQNQIIKILSNFFMEGVQSINFLQFYKCYSSFINFNEILIEQRTQLLKQIIYQLESKKISLDVFQQKLNKNSQFEYIQRAKIKEIFKNIFNKQHLYNNFQQIFAISDENPLFITEFLNQIKAVKFGRNIQKINVKTIIFQIMIKQSVQDVLANDIQSLNIIMATLSAKDLTIKSMCQLLQSLKVQISYWESLLLIQSIKVLYRQDFELLQGRISPNTVLTWLKSVIQSNQSSKKQSKSNNDESRTVNNEQQKHIMVKQSQQSLIKSEQKKNRELRLAQQIQTKFGMEDEIVNIAKLLKQKDKFEYSQSYEKSKGKQQVQNQSKYSNILIKSAQNNNILEQSMKSEKQQYVQKINLIDMKILRYQVIDIKFQSDQSQVYKIQLNFIQKNQIIFKKNKQINEYYSQKYFHQQINIQNIDFYKRQSIRGIQILIQNITHNQDVYMSKGLITIQDIFTSATKKTKKSCVLFNKDNKIIGKVLIQFSIVNQIVAHPVSSIDIFVFISIQNIKLNISEEYIITFYLNNKLIQKDVKRYKNYKILLDQNYFKSSIEIILQTKKNRYKSNIRMESLINNQQISGEIPILNNYNSYEGTMNVNLSKKQIQIIQINLQKDKKFQEIIDNNLFVFIDDLITIGNHKKLQFFISLYSNSKQQSRSQKIEIDQARNLLCNEFKNIKLHINNFNKHNPIQIKLISYPKNQIIASTKLKFINEDKEFQWYKRDYYKLQNKLNIHMRLGVHFVQIYNVQKANILNIMKIFQNEYINKIKMQLQKGTEMNVNFLKQILRKKFYFTFSEINFVCKYLEDRQLLNMIYRQDESRKKKSEAQCLYGQFRFYDTMNEGKILNNKLRQILQAYGYRQNKRNNRIKQEQLVQDQKTDYIQYLGYKTEQNLLERSNLNEIFSKINKMHSQFMHKLN